MAGGPKTRTLLQVYETLYVSQGHGALELKDAGFLSFETKRFQYFGFCDDFGPMNASALLEFVDVLENMLKTFPNRKIVCIPGNDGARDFTNTVFLLGCFLVLNRNKTPEETWKCFAKIGSPSPSLVDYRDATHSAPTFGLTLLDCWCGLDHGNKLGWMAQLNLDEYRHYDDPLNGDLHIVVPGQFVAFRGPKDLKNGREYHDHDGFRDFSPQYYVDIFRELNVGGVVRLNEPEYDRDVFVAAGIAHHDLEFEDCSNPPYSVVTAFMRIVDSTPGPVAVHCKAGLGRTGTLIALDMMRRHGFTARAAMGWLRIMRPGSVIGDQQHYLCEVERRLESATATRSPTTAATATRSPAPTTTTTAHRPAATTASSAAELARQVADGMNRRAAGRIRSGR